MRPTVAVGAVRGWLTYSGAFLVALGVAAALYIFAFRMLMSGAISLSVAGFVGVVFIMPVMAGLVTFGLVYPKLSGVILTGSDRMGAFAFALITTIFFSSLLLSRLLDEMLVLPLFLAVMFIGGRILLARKAND